MKRPDLGDVERGLGGIPALPGVALEMVRLLKADDSQVGDLKRILAHDPDMARGVLELARCHAVHLGRPVDDLSAALSVLGFRTLTPMVLAVSVKAAFRGRAVPVSFDSSMFWHHSFAASTMARHLAEVAGLDTSKADVVALLRDIGKLVIAIGEPDQWTALMGQAGRDGVDVEEIEDRFFATNHVEAGAWLCMKWGLPRDVVSIISRSDAPELSKWQDLLEIVDVVLRLRGLGAPGSQNRRTTSRKLKVDKTRIDSALARADRELTLLAGLFRAE